MFGNCLLLEVDEFGGGAYEPLSAHNTQPGTGCFGYLKPTGIAQRYRCTLALAWSCVRISVVTPSPFSKV
jgi:hypothetical protein